MIRMTVLVTATLWLASCNTVNGMGQDLQAAGRAVSNGAETVQRNVFDGQGQAGPSRTEFRTRAGEPCDPSPDALAGGSSLPPCRVDVPVPARRS